MKKLAVISMLIIGLMGDGISATRPTGRNARADASSNAPVSTDATVARAARSTRAAPSSGASSNTRVVNRGRAATNTPVVSARAATTQKVIGTGTKVATATKNIVVSDECQQKYDGCMDSFCMLDNETGGRCICSNRNAELDNILAEIEFLDQQSYQMATFGVEKIEMGSDADAAIASANAAAQSVIDDTERPKTTRKPLDLSMWDTSFDFETDDDLWGENAISAVEGKTGDNLRRAAESICIEQIPECASDISMLQLMYAQRVKSDCAAYENSLKQQKNASQQKLSAAERALREAALEQLRIANKYDLGQCTVEFKKCMQTTAGCGNDFSACASIAAMDSTNVRQSTSSKSKTYKIKGAITNIEITASTYDTLIAKKPLCDTITKSCVAVADQVWDTFLKEIAPQIKNAEIIAEDNARQDCIGNISNCFQKACKDNIDPNDPEGSFDLCLTRPAAMLNVCKVPLNACGIDATSEANAQKSDIWDFVVARLAAMRVDACTNDVKACLQSDDRCGKNYNNCIGLDLEAIKEMCPLDVLVSCQTKTSDGNTTNYAASWDNIENIVQGIWLSIDNSMLTQCQNIVNERMIELCGDTTTCAAFDDDKAIGTESLLSYQDNDGNYVIDGLISFSNVKVEKTESSDDDVKFGQYEININDYKSHLDTMDPTTARVVSALQSTANKINQKIAVLSQDPQIKMCVQGRDMSQIRGRESATNARFPYLLDSAIMAIISSGLEQANKNYTQKYNDLLGVALEAKDDAVKSTLCAAMAASDEPRCVEYRPSLRGAVCKQYSANTFENVFAQDTQTGMTGDDLYSTKYIISGAKLSDLASAQQQGHSEYTQVDNQGNMIGKIAMAAVYSPDADICTLTTTTTMCSNMKEIITTDTSTTCKSGGFTLLGGNGCKGGGGILNISGGKKTTTTVQNYQGVACLEFMEPETTTVNIQM